MSDSKPVLISFGLCPFVQRSVITLLEKQVDFDITYIDLANPPAWFLDISPFGKVPALRVGDTTVFESAVINEYLDEINPPSMHPVEPLRKAVNRAWIEFASDLLGQQYMLSIATDEKTFEEKHAAILKRLAQLEAQLQDGPFFNGAAFSLIDAAFAPVFMRFELLQQRYPLALYEDAPKVQRWSQDLVQRRSVVESVPPDFEPKYFDYIKNTNGYAAELFA